MLKELFESSFYITFPKKSGCVLNIDEQKIDHDFSLCDKKACSQCRNVCNTQPNKREQLLVKTSKQVWYVSIDQVVSYINESVGETCDFMIDDGSRVALIEMTCSTIDYAGSKRKTARRQLKNTLCILMANPDIKQHIDSEYIKEVIFSWKETVNSSQNPDMIEKSFLDMLSMDNEIYSADNVSSFESGFSWREIKYDDKLIW